MAEAAAFYQLLLETFVQELRRYGWHFNESVLGQDIEGWRTLREITDNIRKFVDAAIDSGRLDILREASSLAYRLADFGLEEREYLTYKTSIDLLTSVYVRHAQFSDRVREYAKEHPPLLITEIVNWRLLTAIEEAEEPDDLATLGSFAKVALVSFQNLLVSALTLNNTAEFKSLLKRCSQLFSPMQLPLRGSAKELVVVQSDGIAFSLEEAIQLVRIGAGVRIVIEVEKGNESAVSFLGPLLFTLPTTGELAAIMLKALGSDIGSDFGWDFWEMEPGGGMGVIRTDEWLGTLYALRTITSHPPASIPFGPASKSLADAVENLSGRLQDPKYVSVLTGTPPEHIEQLRRLHSDAVNRQERAEEDQIMEAPLSQDRIGSLEADIWQHDETDDGIRQVYESAGRIETTEDCPDEVLRQPDAWIPRVFMTELPSWAPSMAAELGQAVAQYRREILLESIAKDDAVTSSRDARELWSDLASWFADRDTGAGLAILTGNWRLWQMRDDRFQERWQLADDVLLSTLGFAGRFRGIPVFHTYEGQNPRAYVIDVRRHGRFVDRIFDGRRARLEVEGFDEDAAKSRVQVRGPLKQGDRELTTTDSIRWLRLNVRLRIIYRIQYVVEAETASASFSYLETAEAS